MVSSWMGSQNIGILGIDGLIVGIVSIEVRVDSLGLDSSVSG